ncbi:MAG: MBL fold metallo-hydrolase [Desulfobacterales bacterium]|nr:MBL fold metallo-hydrolase [Desulfobacterales bacterium]
MVRSEVDPILIEIKQKMPGHDRFIGSWACRGDVNIIADVGPANSADKLIGSLTAMGISRIDFILLTHIHIDHSGGLAQLLDQFPMAKAICHGKGIRHLVEPSKLWHGSRQALGKIAEAYGYVLPVSRERLIPHTEPRIRGLKIIETPGHAPHHLSFCFRGHLFAGEAGGNYFTVNGKEYLRPATPPRFFLKHCLNSVDRLLAMEDQPICYAHFGQAGSSVRLLNMFRDQLMLWENIVREEISGAQSDLVGRCAERVLREDPRLEAFQSMDADTRNRERFFIANSIKGFAGFLQDNG